MQSFHLPPQEAETFFFPEFEATKNVMISWLVCVAIKKADALEFTGRAQCYLSILRKKNKIPQDPL